MHERNEILECVKKFNSAVRSAIEGPNCVDPQVCDGNCCFIHIDVPKTLIEYYLENNLADIDNFQRGSTFSFEIQVDLKTLRCVFYDKQINGCKLHFSGMKPPQCWVYPTGLDPIDVKTSCKKAEGWKIINPENTLQAKKILETYVKLAKMEGQAENSETEILNRLQHGETQMLEEINNPLKKKISPKELGCISDEWDRILLLQSDGLSFTLKSICSTLGCQTEFLSCDSICISLVKKLYELLRIVLPDFIKKNGWKREYFWLEILPKE